MTKECVSRLFTSQSLLAHKSFLQIVILIGIPINSAFIFSGSLCQYFFEFLVKWEGNIGKCRLTRQNIDFRKTFHWFHAKASIMIHVDGFLSWWPEKKLWIKEGKNEFHKRACRFFVYYDLWWHPRFNSRHDKAFIPRYLDLWTGGPGFLKNANDALGC